MIEFECPGLPADWVNGWLAAVGVTVLDARVSLRWSAQDTPVAVLSAADIDPLAAIVESWPDASLLSDLPIARDWRQGKEMKRHVTLDVFRERAAMARRHPYSWALSSTLTDLALATNVAYAAMEMEKQQVEHAPFDPAVPRGWTLHDRLVRLHESLELSTLRSRVQGSLTGEADRERGNGLGFDHYRIGSLADDTDPWVDPIVEVLAFFGLAILPMRGAAGSPRQRGWRRDSTAKRGTRHFTWPAWTQPLDSLGVDALLDVWRPDYKQTWPLLGVNGGWRTIELMARGQSDPTKAYGTERL